MNGIMQTLGKMRLSANRKECVPSFYIKSSAYVGIPRIIIIASNHLLDIRAANSMFDNMLRENVSLLELRHL